MEIDGVRAKIVTGEHRFSDHAVKRMIKRSIDLIEIKALRVRLWVIFNRKPA
jgi:hypothetical protein